MTSPFLFSQLPKPVPGQNGQVMFEVEHDAFDSVNELLFDDERTSFLDDHQQDERLLPGTLVTREERELDATRPTSRQETEDTPMTSPCLSPPWSLSPSSQPSSPASPCIDHHAPQPSVTLLEEKIHAMLELHHLKLQENQVHHTDALMEQLVGLQSQIGRLEDDLFQANAKIASQMQEIADIEAKSFELQKQSVALQQSTLDKLMRLQTSISAVLTQTFELHEYPTPRLFIVLPDVPYQGLNPSSLLSNVALTKFRLYFLCECGGPHTSPVGPHQLNHIHIARHNGYEITRPTEFFSKYGTYIHKLLMMLKNGISLATVVVPMLSFVKATDLPERLAKGLDDKVTASIQLLSRYQDAIDVPAPGIHSDKVESTVETNSEAIFDSDRSVLGQSSGNVTMMPPKFLPLEGADLRMLNSFLKTKDRDRTLGNLFRTVNDHGHIKWICLDHYRATYHKADDRLFEHEVSLNQGTYDRQLGRVSVVLSSSAAAETFMAAMSRAYAIHELELHLRNYSYQDLRSLGTALSNTNVSKLTLRAHQYKDYLALGKRRIHAILKMMSTGKIRYLHLKQIKDMFPQHAIVPKEMLAIHSLELTAMSVKDGHETLGDILKACKNLVELKLTEVPLKLQQQTSVMNALVGCTKLSALSLRACDIPSKGSKVISSTLKELKQLKELNLGFNLLEDDGICEIVEAIRGQLEKLWLPYTAFGDASAMALESSMVSMRLTSLDLSDSVNELDTKGVESILRLTGRLDRCTELVLPRMAQSSDESCSRMIRQLSLCTLQRLEMQGSDCGDLTAVALAEALSDLLSSHLALESLSIDLPSITLQGANILGRALGNCQFVKLSLRYSHLFQSSVPEPELLQDFFRNACSWLTVLDLRWTQMSDQIAMVLCDCMAENETLCKLQSLDVSRNQMSALGGSKVLECVQSMTSIRVLRIESPSFREPGSMGPAVMRFLEVNKSVHRLSVSHVNLKELTQGLRSRSHVLKSIEVQYVDGEPDDTHVDDIFEWGDFLQSNANKLLRLVVKRARYLCQCLKKNKTILDLEWEFDQGWKVDSYVLQRYIERNRELWRKNAGSQIEDLIQAGMDPWTIRAVCHSYG
ncbi:RNA-DNA hybrid ribonuclease [Podila epigama]|nr:RNA-DNA hybrid ribonuclease [Podila epigama]